jgi:hypothetical protein
MYMLETCCCEVVNNGSEAYPSWQGQVESPWKYYNIQAKVFSNCVHTCQYGEADILEFGNISKVQEISRFRRPTTVHSKIQNNNKSIAK